MKPEYQRRLFQEIHAAGKDLGLVNFGMRALLCLRLEKNFPTWFRELRPIYGGFEGGMERFIALDKNDFVGREAAAKEKAEGGKLRRVSMVVDADDCDVLGDEPIWQTIDRMLDELLRRRATGPERRSASRAKADKPQEDLPLLNLTTRSDEERGS